MPVSLNHLKPITSKLASIATILLSLSTLLVCTEPQSQENNLTIGIADLVVNKVFGNSLSSRIENGQNILANQRIRTGRDSATSISLKDDSIIKIGEIADVYMDNIVFDRTGSSLNGSMEMVTGLLRFTSGKIHRMNLKIQTGNLTIGIRGTQFDLLANRSKTEIKVTQGQVQVSKGGLKTLVSEGQIYLADENTSSGLRKKISKELKQAILKLESLTGNKLISKNDINNREEEKKISSNNQNLLKIYTTKGLITIRMLPSLAERHVTRIKELVTQKFYDNLIFHSVRKGFAVETGDPTGTGSGGSGKKLLAEISKTPFERGTVAMKRNRNNPNSGDSQFFITLRRAPHLDGKYTIWGKVIGGMGLLEEFQAGNPPINPERIINIKIAD
ncbi:MAG: peptidylprolyl isomerase [Rhodospirillales bacterium]